MDPRGRRRHAPPRARDGGRAGARTLGADGRGRELLAAAAAAPPSPAYVGARTQLSNYLTLKGSFSAVSKPNFARKYALESSRRDLQNALLCTVLESNPQNQENRGEKRTWSRQPREK